MKQISILFLFFVLSVANTNAQTQFAPAGSEWYQSMMPYGVYHCYNAGDTTISGTTCHKIVRKAITADPYYSMGLHVDDLVPLYVYNNNDTVFLYNTLFHRFTPLYVFNVSAGDTLRLPIIPLDVDYLTYISTDSVFSIVIDSVRMKLYDTATLKTVYSHSLGNADSNYVYRYCGYDSVGAYAENLGTLTAGFLPRADPFVNIADDHLQYAGSIRCYSDPSMSVKLTSGICGIPPTAVIPVSLQHIAIFPNPASDVINITNFVPGAAITLTDMSGRVVSDHFTSTTSSATVPLSGIPSGIYLLKITSSDEMVYYRKISVMH